MDRDNLGDFFDPGYTERFLKGEKKEKTPAREHVKAIPLGSLVCKRAKLVCLLCSCRYRLLKQVR